LSLIYGLGVWIRNKAYDNAALKTYRSTIFTISVGNLTAGGTGKTPHVLYILNKLSRKYKIATLSRGYGRGTRGFVEATQLSTSRDIGDEPLQIYRQFGHDVVVAVCEKRAVGLQKIESQYPKTQLVLLDDAFQHRAILPTLNIVLTDFGRLFYQDFLLPMGLLREPRSGIRRADAVIVTKCPSNLSQDQQANIRNQMANYVSPHTPVFFSTFSYAAPQPYFPNQPSWNSETPCLLVSGIAQPQLFETAAKQYFKVEEHLIFGDHHDFSASDLRHICQKSAQKIVLTTEKDFVKLQPLLANQLPQNLFYYWPIEVAFLPSETIAFDDWLTQKLALSLS
jgi:tetraacyldisaccharide 4'-kinase